MVPPIPCGGSPLLTGHAPGVAPDLAAPEYLGKDPDASEDDNDADEQRHAVARRASARYDHVATVTV